MSISAKFVVAAALVGGPVMATNFHVTGSSVIAPYSYLRIQTGDFDGDGIADEGVLRLACTGGAISSAWVYAPRDSASGMATGKRQHKPFTMVKEWGAASPQIFQRKGGYVINSSKKGYDYYQVQNIGRVAKTMAMDDWHAIGVTGLDGACAALSADKVSVHDLSVTK